jgi:hypothetical protein
MNRSELTNSQEKPTDERVTRIDKLGSWFVARGPRLVDIVSGDLGSVRLTGGLCRVCAHICAPFETAETQQWQGLERSVRTVHLFLNQSSI